MKPKVIVYSRMSQKALDYIKETCEVVEFERLNKDNYPSFLQELKNSEGLVGADLQIDASLLKNAPRLKVVSNISVGYDNFNIKDISENHIMATNTPDILNDTTADTMFGLLLMAGRRMVELDRYVKKGQWTKSVGKELFGVDLHHKTLGIIGMGGIGTAIAKRAHLGFDMNILYHNRSRNEEAEKMYDATYCSLEELLKQSDYICLMTPLTPQTEKMISEKEFKLMKKSAVFVNGSRGKTVDEAALILALQNKEILAAGLDVFEIEPVQTNNPLLTMENVVTLPHIGSATYETRMKMAMLAAENVVKGVHGELPPCLINKEVFKG